MQMELDPNITMIAIVTGIGYLMVVSGLHKSMLEWRRVTRSCPSCGRTIEARVCGTCSR
jgi:hypothetical protein